jgi:hypothetical protein
MCIVIFPHFSWHHGIFHMHILYIPVTDTTFFRTFYNQLRKEIKLGEKKQWKKPGRKKAKPKIRDETLTKENILKDTLE